MTPAAFRAHLGALQWTQHGLAAMLAMNERQVRRWASGATPIPERIAAWVEHAARELPPLMAAVDAWHENNPPPAKKAD
jgi:DNA-binding transcriptional regulator YdaS (Cro superfamily)